MNRFSAFFGPCYQCCSPQCIDIILTSFRLQFMELLATLGDDHVSRVYTTKLCNNTHFYQLLKRTLNKNIHKRLLHQYDKNYLHLIGVGIANIVVLKLLDYTSSQIESFCLSYTPSTLEKNNTFVIFWLTKDTEQKIASTQPHPFIHLMESTLVAMIHHEQYNFDYYFGHIIKQSYETLNPMGEHQHLKSVVI